MCEASRSAAIGLRPKRDFFVFLRCLFWSWRSEGGKEEKGAALSSAEEEEGLRWAWRMKRKASQERRDEDGGGEWGAGGGGVLGEAGGRKGRKKGTITSGRLLPRPGQPGRLLRQNMVAARSKATFVLLSGSD